MAELPGRELLVGIAQYNPASATAVSRTSSTLFIGGVSSAHTSTRGEVYAESMLREPQDLWIIVVSCGYPFGVSWSRGLPRADGFNHPKGTSHAFNVLPFAGIAFPRLPEKLTTAMPTAS